MDRATTDMNVAAFQRLEPALERSHPRKVVVMQNERPLAYGKDYGEAFDRALAKADADEEFYIARVGPYDEDIICMY